MDFKIYYLIIFILVCILILILIFKILNYRTIKKLPINSKLVFYRLFYADQNEEKDENGFGRILCSDKYNLQGKPDYIYKQILGEKLVPIELKSGKIGNGILPHKGDYLQLCAYFLIIEEEFKIRPKFGRLVYSDCVFQVRNTGKVRKEVVGVINNMWDMLENGEGVVNPSFPKCRRCVCRGTVCEFYSENNGKREN